MFRSQTVGGPSNAVFIRSVTGDWRFHPMWGASWSFHPDVFGRMNKRHVLSVELLEYTSEKDDLNVL